MNLLLSNWRHGIVGHLIEGLLHHRKRSGVNGVGRVLLLGLLVPELHLAFLLLHSLQSDLTLVLEILLLLLPHQVELFTHLKKEFKKSVVWLHSKEICFHLSGRKPSHAKLNNRSRFINRKILQPIKSCTIYQVPPRGLGEMDRALAFIIFSSLGYKELDGTRHDLVLPKCR